MGLAIFTIKFDTGFPPLEAIKAQFLKQTGLNVWVTAKLKMDKINLPYIEMISVLVKNSQEVHQLQTHHQNLILAQPQNYEKLAQSRDYTSRKLSRLNSLTEFQFHISQFYALDFQIQDDVIEIESYPGQYYGIVSLNKTLLDLGGKDFEGEKSYPEKWNKLKKWHHYKWYNRPRK
jgi:hypothetical protein